MKDKKQIQAFLLGWALGAIIFCTTFAWIIGIERSHYEKKIEVLERKCSECDGCGEVKEEINNL
jgi:hypothetical protein